MFSQEEEILEQKRIVKSYWQHEQCFTIFQQQEDITNILPPQETCLSTEDLRSKQICAIIY